MPLGDRLEESLGFAHRRVPRTTAFFVDWAKRFLEVEGIDRSIVLAAQAFTALFPFMIVYASIVPRSNGGDFADSLVDRFDLSGASAASIERAFAPPDSVQSSVTFFGILFLVFSALSFTRALQRTYERSWQLEKYGMAGTMGWGLAWLVALGFAYSVRPALQLHFGGILDAASTIAVSAAIWLMTPYILLERRMPWRRLLPSALLTASGMTALTVAAAIYLPRSVAMSAQRYGVIGVAFSLLGVLIGASFVIVLAATGGAAFANPGRWAALPTGHPRRMRRRHPPTSDPSPRCSARQSASPCRSPSASRSARCRSSPSC